MANFNTYQTRNLYVVKDFLASGDPDAAGELAMGTTATGEIFFKYYNGDELLTRTDLIRPASIISLKKTAAAEMDIPLPAYTIVFGEDVDTSHLENYVGKVFTLTINLHQVLSYDDNDSMAITASLVGNATNLATASAFYNAFAKEILKVMPKWTKKAPFKVYALTTSSATEVTGTSASVSSCTGIALIPVPCDYRRGVMSKEIFTLSYTSRLHGDDVAWAAEMEDASNLPIRTVAALNTELSTSLDAVIPSVYTIADLEYFTFGERGDDKRLFNWPHNYEPTYLITDFTKKYDVVSIEFAWQGNAENIQKSPRMIQFACEGATGSAATSLAGEIYDAVTAAMAGVSE